MRIQSTRALGLHHFWAVVLPDSVITLIQARDEILERVFFTEHSEQDQELGDVGHLGTSTNPTQRDPRVLQGMSRGDPHLVFKTHGAKMSFCVRVILRAESKNVKTSPTDPKLAQRRQCTSEAEAK